MSQENEEVSGRKVGIILGLSIVLILFSWIGITIYNLVEQSRLVYIHNPYEDPMKVTIGEETYKLGPLGYKEVGVSEGKQRIKSTVNGQVILDTTVVISSAFLNKGGVINASREPMYLWSECYGGTLDYVYSFDDSSTINSKPSSQWSKNSAGFFTIDSTLLYGVVNKYLANQVLITKEWDYDIPDPCEDQVEARDVTQGAVGTSKSKIFNKPGLLRYWNRNYGDLQEELELLQILDSVQNSSDTITP
ncbi:MAG: hypothetical protein DCO96_14150 [Fluviicola sp. XM-24bin1]|nr:MAG: hypothetical protein DCO96_14150 [Fluviicola sp. XM-24bin1]